MNHRGALKPKILTILLTITTLAVAPWFSIEPINAPKFLFMTTAGLFSLGAVLLRINFLGKENPASRIFLGIMFSLLLANLTIFANSEIGWRQQLFGYLGRNTGLIFYLSLIFICVFVYLESNSKFESSIVNALHFTGGFSLIYSLVQSVNLDFINWKNPYNAIIGFQGNPNFQSSFLGIYSILLLHSFFDSTIKARIRIFLTITLIMNLYVIVLSESIQGLFVFFIGAGVLVWNQLKLSRIKYLVIPYLVSGFVMATLTVFGLLKLGPLKFFYQPSVSFRGDYWRAGMRMIRDNPWFGLGHSSFGDYYKHYRDTKSLSGIDGRGADTFSNSAHNIFIDIFASGGLVLFIPYLAVIILSLYFLAKMHQANRSLDRNLVLFGSLWLGYLSQTLISVQFVTLAFWGWVFLAIFLQHSIKFKIASVLKDISSTTRARPKKSFSGSTSPVVVFFLIAGLLIGVLPLRAGIIQKNAYESRRADLILNSAFHEPLDIDRMNQIALLLVQNNRVEDAMKILDRAATITQSNSDTWKFIYKLSEPGSAKQQKARGIIEIIDPYNDYLK